MVNIYIEGQLIDQYDDESVEVVSQVLDLEDITKTKGDYSKTFTVPASKTNNKIFKHWYNPSIDGGFDARVKVSGNIDIEGIPFKKGKFLLRSAKIKNGIIDSYEINFFGNVTNLKDILGESKLSDLNFDDIDFNYTSGMVKNKFESDPTDLYPDTVFTTISKKRFFYGSTSSGDFGSYTEAIDWQKENNTSNISFANNTGAGVPNNKAIGIHWTDLEASLRADKIIEAIENTYPSISFTRDFFDTTEFKRLYMLMSSSEGPSQLNVENQKVDYVNYLDYDGTGLQTSAQTLTSTGTDITTYYNAPTGAPLVTSLAVLPTTIGTAEVRIRLFVNLGDGNGYSLKQEVTGSCTRGATSSGNLEFKTPSTETRQLLTGTANLRHYYEVDTLNGLSVNCKLWQSTSISNSYYTYGTQNFSGEYGVALNMPDIKTIDFLKGLFGMFKLVVVPREDGKLYINTINSFYSQGNRYDISKYVDRSSFSVRKGDLVGSVELSTEPNDSVMNYGFRQNNNREYGDFKVEFVDDNGDSLDGSAIKLESPFENLVFERLSNQFNTDSGVTNIQCGHLVDKEIKPLNVGCVLHYISSQDVSEYPIGFVDSGNNFVKLDDSIFVPSHTLTIDDPFNSTLFGEEFSTWNGAKVEASLYNSHYKNYIDGLKNISGRIIEIKAKLPVITSANLSMNDVLVYDGVSYRINKFNYNLLTGLSKLELINGLDTSLAPFNGAPSVLYVGIDGDDFQFNLPNADDYTISKVNLGDGTSWISTSTSFELSRNVDLPANAVNIDVGAYAGTDYGYRRMKINFTLSGNTTDILIVQRKKDLIE